MTADLTREQARDRVALVIAAQRYHYGAAVADRDADAALTVLWPVVEVLRAELAHAHTVIARHVEPRREGVRPVGYVLGYIDTDFIAEEWEVPDVDFPPEVEVHDLGLATDELARINAREERHSPGRPKRIWRMFAVTPVEVTP